MLRELATALTVALVSSASAADNDAADIARAASDDILIITNAGYLKNKMNQWCNNKNMSYIGNWDLSALRNFKGALKGRTSCQKGLHGMKQWDTGNLLDMTRAFMDSTIYKDVDFSQWNVENVKSFREAFKGAEIKGIGLPNWTPYSVTSVAQMFRGAEGMDFIDVDGNLTSWATLWAQREDNPPSRVNMFTDSDYPEVLKDEFKEPLENGPGIGHLSDKTTTGAVTGDASSLALSATTVLGATALLFTC